MVRSSRFTNQLAPATLVCSQLCQQVFAAQKKTNTGFAWGLRTPWKCIWMHMGISVKMAYTRLSLRMPTLLDSSLVSWSTSLMGIHRDILAGYPQISCFLSNMPRSCDSGYDVCLCVGFLCQLSSYELGRFIGSNRFIQMFLVSTKFSWWSVVNGSKTKCAYMCIYVHLVPLDICWADGGWLFQPSKEDSLSATGFCRTLIAIIRLFLSHEVLINH